MSGNEHVAEPFRSILDSVAPKAGGGAGGPSRSLHTPGPWGETFYDGKIMDDAPGWMVTHPGKSVIRARMEADDFPITSMKVCDVTHGAYIDIDTAGANARLIAAAPDLLAACMKAEAIVAFDRKSIVACESVGGDESTLDAEGKQAIEVIDAVLIPLRAAIAKAEGGAA